MEKLMEKYDEKTDGEIGGRIHIMDKYDGEIIK